MRPADPFDLTPKDVADLTGLSLGTVKRLADAGDLPCFRVTTPGKKVGHAVRKFRRSDVDAFVAAHTTGTPAGADAYAPGG